MRYRKSLCCFACLWLIVGPMEVVDCRSKFLLCCFACLWLIIGPMEVVGCLFRTVRNPFRKSWRLVVGGKNGMGGSLTSARSPERREERVEVAKKKKKTKCHHRKSPPTTASGGWVVGVNEIVREEGGEGAATKNHLWQQRTVVGSEEWLRSEKKEGIQCGMCTIIWWR
ncbi:hypothetical protein E2542_SST08782 [Spatholobus suberectus]|nr:hypothetical protein E2542_SST08782 [Spatholobus suberectus]